MTRMHEREQKRDACYQNDKVWVAGVTNMIAKTMKRAAEGQEEREREREVTATTEGGGLKASEHADMMREVGPKSASSRSNRSNRSPGPNCSSNCSQNCSPCTSESQQPYPHP
jgi:hypothetical protein